MVRIKHRYLLVNILYPEQKASPPSAQRTTQDDVPYSIQFRRPSPDQVSVKLLSRLIRDGVAELFGDYGSGKIASSLNIKYFSPATSTMIIRVSRDHYRLVWAALTYVTRLPQPVNQACVMQVVRVSGTIRKAEEEAIRRARLSIRHVQKEAGRVNLGMLGGADADDMHSAGIEATNDPFGMATGIEDADDGSDG